MKSLKTIVILLSTLFGLPVYAAGVNMITSNFFNTAAFTVTTSPPSSYGPCSFQGKSAYCLTSQDLGLTNAPGYEEGAYATVVGGASDYLKIGVYVPDTTNPWQFSLMNGGQNDAIELGITNQGGWHFQTADIADAISNGTFVPTWSAVATSTAAVKLGAVNWLKIVNDGSTFANGTNVFQGPVALDDSQGNAQAGFYVGSSSTPFTAHVVSAVPIPAAVWLFGSGLVGLVGIARRKPGSV